MTQVSGNSAYVMIAVTATSSLFVYFQPFPAPFNIEWAAIHLTLGLIMIALLVIHFVAKHHVCAQMSKKD